MPYPKTKLCKEVENGDSMQKGRHKKIPGYTGYIPGGKDLFGERYAVLIKRAKEDRNDHKALPKMSLRYDLSKTKSRKASPLKPIADKAKMYFPKLVQHSVSPYTMTNDQPGKHFIAGYTGLVPRARQFMGMRYQLATNKALCKFHNKMKDFISYRDKQIELDRKSGRQIETVTIYNPESGMVPCYTGHVQGAKYKFGKRFGDSTKEAICKAKESTEDD